MRMKAFCSAAILLAAGTLASGQATLPAFYSGPWSTTNLPTGWTKFNLGSDYTSSYDDAGGNAGKLDSAGDWLQVNFSTTPATVSYWVKRNGTSTNAYSFKVQESATGSTWSNVASFSDSGPTLPGTETPYTNNLQSASRYVRLIYDVKASGINVGFDAVRVAAPGVPTVTFNPNGTTNAPVSNQFTMAVSITPSGAGMQSWSMTPVYAGPASLTNGNFSFTPAGGDNGKTFTVSVIATNSVGTSTGTTTIVVTPYVAPVPVITFSPTGTYSIMATYTQKLGIGVSPAGSGIQGWTFLPSNYAGTASLVGTNFTYVSAAADGPSNYTLSVIATNSFGTRTGSVDIAVSAYVPPPPPGAYIVTFEDGSKPGYASADVVLSNKTWNLTGILIGSDADDKKIGSKSARLKFDPSDGEETMTLLTNVMANGISTISLWCAPYGNHGADAPTLAIEVSESLTAGWVQVGEVAVSNFTELTYYSADVYISMPVYVRIRASSGVNNRSANFDNITIAPYTSPAATPYDAFLLQYNVTPGDPGTAAAEDLDGDGFSNTNEFTAGTNPYDHTIHP